MEVTTPKQQRASTLNDVIFALISMKTRIQISCIHDFLPLIRSAPGKVSQNSSPASTEISSLIYLISFFNISNNCDRVSFIRTSCASLLKDIAFPNSSWCRSMFSRLSSDLFMHDASRFKRVENLHQLLESSSKSS